MVWLLCAVCSWAKSENVLRKPWGVACRRFMRVIRCSIDMDKPPARLRAMKMKALPSSRGRASSNATAAGDSGTRCSRLAFMRAAGPSRWQSRS